MGQSRVLVGRHGRLRRLHQSGHCLPKGGLQAGKRRWPGGIVPDLDGLNRLRSGRNPGFGDPVYRPAAPYGSGAQMSGRNWCTACAPIKKMNCRHPEHSDMAHHNWLFAGMKWEAAKGHTRQSRDSCPFNYEDHRHIGPRLLYCSPEGHAGRKYSEKTQKRMTASTFADRLLTHPTLTPENSYS